MIKLHPVSMSQNKHSTHANDQPPSHLEAETYKSHRSIISPDMMDQLNIVRNTVKETA